MPDDDRLNQLQNWLTQGWQVEQPVLLRTALHTFSGRLCAFEVVVYRGAERQVLALADTAAVHQWLEQTRLPIIAL